MNSKGIVVLVTCAGLATASSAQAIFFGSMGTLGPRATTGLEMAGAYAGFSSHSTGAFGQVRFGVGSDMLDVGAEGSYSHYSEGGFSSNSGGGQVDVKAALFHPSQTNRNIHAGGDAALFFEKSSDEKTIGFTDLPAVSVGAPAGNGAFISGWAGLGLIWGHTSIDNNYEVPVERPSRIFRGRLARIQGVDSSLESSSNDSAALLQLGGGYDFTDKIGIAAEFRHEFTEGSGSDIMFGVNFGLKGSSEGANMGGK